MTTRPFGPQLIGETEKALNALLRRFLAGTDLTESQWVALRLARQLQRDGGDGALATALRERALLDDAELVVRDLTARHLLDRDRPTGAGLDVIETVQTAIVEATTPIWDALDPDDVAASARVLDEVNTRVRAMLG
jgi:hypothetical protein